MENILLCQTFLKKSIDSTFKRMKKISCERYNPMVSLSRKKFLRIILFRVAAPAVEQQQQQISPPKSKGHRRCAGIIYQIGSRVMYQTQNKTRLLYNTKYNTIATAAAEAAAHKHKKEEKKLLLKKKKNNDDNVLNYIVNLSNDLIEHILTFLSLDEIKCVENTQYKLYSMLNKEQWCNLYKRIIQNIAKKNVEKLWSFSNRRQTWRPMSGYNQMMFQASPGHLKRDGTLIMMQDLHQSSSPSSLSSSSFLIFEQQQQQTTDDNNNNNHNNNDQKYDGMNIVFTRIFEAKKNLFENLLQSIEEYNQSMFGILRCRMQNERPSSSSPSPTIYQIHVLKHMVHYIHQRNQKHAQYHICSPSLQFNIPWNTWSTNREQ